MTVALQHEPSALQKPSVVTIGPCSAVANQTLAFELVFSLITLLEVTVHFQPAFSTSEIIIKVAI